MIFKLSSHYLLDLVYSQLTCSIFILELIVGNAQDQFWQKDTDFWTIIFKHMASWSLLQSLQLILTARVY